jgi:hypothetical protein
MSEAAASPLEDATNRVRDSAKWLLTTAGAVGAALLVGVQLTSLGKLDQGTKIFAVLVVLFGLVGIGFAIWGVARLLLPVSVTLTELVALPLDDPIRKFLDTNPELLRGFASTQELGTSRRADVAAWNVAFANWQADTKDPERVRALQVAVQREQVSREAVETVSEWAALQSLTRDYHRALRKIVPGIVVAALAAIIFVFLAAPPAAAETATKPPVRNLAGLTLSFGQLSGVDLSGADLSDTKFRNSNLEKATLTKTTMTRTDFSGANLRGADLSGVKLDSVVWEHTTCPDGTNSDLAGGTCAAHLGAP